MNAPLESGHWEHSSSTTSRCITILLLCTRSIGEPLNVGRMGSSRFPAFGKFHQLNLRPDREIFTGDAKIVSPDGKPIPFDRDAVVRGKVEGHPSSDVYGVIDKDDGFHGKILSGSENYYVDPSSWYFDEKQDFPSVIYKDTDLEYDHNFADINQRVPSIKVPERTRRSLSNQDQGRVRRQTQEQLEKDACTLGLYADNFFHSTVRWQNESHLPTCQTSAGSSDHIHKPV